MIPKETLAAGAHVQIYTVQYNNIRTGLTCMGGMLKPPPPSKEIHPTLLNPDYKEDHQEPNGIKKAIGKQSMTFECFQKSKYDITQ